MPEPLATVTQLVPSGTSVPYALPVPNAVGLAGLTLTAQSAHLEAGGGISTSRGVELQIQTLPAPSIDPIAPIAPLPNTTVTVTGRHFYPGMQLRVAGQPTPIVSQTATACTFVMPAGVQCDASLSLTNLGGGTSTAPIHGTPSVTLMSTSGPAAGGALFYLVGQNLDAALLTIGGQPLATITSQTRTSITGYTPAGTVGPALVVITGATGCSTTATYTYQWPARAASRVTSSGPRPRPRSPWPPPSAWPGRPRT